MILNLDITIIIIIKKKTIRGGNTAFVDLSHLAGDLQGILGNCPIALGLKCESEEFPFWGL